MFDLHKIQNPDVEGVEYQQRPQYGFDNLETKAPTFMGMIRNKLKKRLKAKTTWSTPRSVTSRVSDVYRTLVSSASSY